MWAPRGPYATCVAGGIEPDDGIGMIAQKPPVMRLSFCGSTG
jgi:hypothetical protein